MTPKQRDTVRSVLPAALLIAVREACVADDARMAAAGQEDVTADEYARLHAAARDKWVAVGEEAADFVLQVFSMEELLNGDAE